MNYNQNSGYGLAETIRMHLNIPALGKILMVCPSTDANYDRLSDLVKTDPNGVVRLYTTVNAAYAAATTNANDVILLQGNSSHTLSEVLTITKSRIHFIGMDGGGRYIQQGAKVQNAAGTAAVYVVKNTGTRNTFRNIKFIQTDDEATSLTCFQEGGEGTVFENCSFVIADVDNLDQTNAYDFVMGGDSCIFKECTFGLDTLLTSAGRAVMMFDQVKSGQEAKNNIFKDCLWQIASSSTDANFIRIAATGDVKFGSVFINPIMLCGLNASMSAAAIDDAVDSVASLIEGNFLFVNPAANATEFCTGVSDQMQVVGPAVSQQAGEAVTPA